MRGKKDATILTITTACEGARLISIAFLFLALLAHQSAFWAEALFSHLRDFV